MGNPKIYILTGASGTGKSTLDDYLKELGLVKLITHTTRTKRKNEIEDQNYYFTNNEDFHLLEKIEFTEYPNGSSNFYGLSKNEVIHKLKGDRDVYTVLDWNGVSKLRELFSESVIVIYLTISIQEMEKRMMARGDDYSKIQERLNQAIQTQELEQHKCADYVIENVNIEESKKQLKNIVLGL